MIKLPKQIAFILLILSTVLLAIAFANIDWDVLSNNEGFNVIFKEIREPIIFLLLVVFFINYYVGTLKEEK